MEGLIAPTPPPRPLHAPFALSSGDAEHVARSGRHPMTTTPPEHITQHMYIMFHFVKL